MFSIQNEEREGERGREGEREGEGERERERNELRLVLSYLFSIPFISNAKRSETKEIPVLKEN